MITVADYYKKNKPTTANSREIDYSSDEKSIFPESIYVGELESATGHKVPALISLAETNGICFLTHSGNRELIHQTMQTIALRLILSLPAGLCKFTLYDGKSSGANLISLSNISAKIKGENILTDPNELKRALDAAQKDIPNIIQKVLGHKYLGKSLIDYNAEAGALAKPYHFIFIADYPNLLTKEHAESIEKIIASGRQVGIFVIMSMDTSCQLKNDYDRFNPMSVMDNMTTIYESTGSYYIKNLPQQDLFNKSFQFYLDNSFPDAEAIEQIQDKINNSLKKGNNAKVDITLHLTEKNFWSRNGSLGVEIPIGILNVTNLQNFMLSIEDGNESVPYHCLIGGATGEGKTVLLHNIICNTA